MSKIDPIGIQNFEKIRRDGYFYIDKTALVYQMVKTGSYFFLNRPRRFGKSLLVSTLEAYFEGKRELFEGLAIEKLEGSAEEALRQINEKNYAQPFTAAPRKLFKIGINFSSQTRNIERWIVE